MKNTEFKRKGTIYVLLVCMLIVILSAVTVSVFAADGTTDGWTFSKASVGDPMYVKDYYDELPRAYEAEVNFPSGTYSNASPIISNYRNNDTKDCFGFEIHASGKPAMYFYQTEYEPSNNKVWRIKTYIKFDNYNVIGKGWVRLAVANEIDESTGKSIYKLYVNGDLVQTVDNYTVNVYEGNDQRDGYKNYAHDIDAIYSQSTSREISIGNDGVNYFKGQLRSVAVYENALTTAEAKNTAKANMQLGDTNLMAYYDSTMSGNADGFIKDHTGNGHDASKAFFTRKDALNDYAYSFAFVGDTQFLMYRDASQNTTSYTKPIYDWIVKNKDEKNIQFVFGLGDITDRNEYIEWEKALDYHEMLEDADIPYAIIPGNHDDYTNHVKYNAYFGEVDYFTDRITGYYKDGRVENYYMNFDVGEHKYMVIGLQYGAPDEILAWANKVVAENSDRKVIVITHALFGYEGDWSEADTREQASTSVKTLNNGIDMWNEFISLHENIIITAAGHIDPFDIKHRTDVGVNGNTVNSFLIDPQGLDKGTDFKTGMVAMFYFSEDGSEVQIEYVSATKTLAAQKNDPDAEDILYNERNQFKVNLYPTDTVSQYTEYGILPESCVSAGNSFAIFSGGEYLGGYKTWNAATSAIDSILSIDAKKEIQILLLKNYNNTGDSLSVGALNTSSATLTIDLGGYAFERGSTFLNLNYSDVSNTASVNIVVKNGTVKSFDGPVIDNQISNKAYTANKVWNLTFENVTFGYSENLASTKGVFYQAWTNDATADGYGTTTNITLNNCTLDLKTNAPEAVTLFNMADDRAINKINVNLRVNGGAVLADVSALANVTFYKLDSGDSVLFGAYEGEYTKLITHTTAMNYAHYSASFPASDGDRYFVEIADDGVNSTYELQSLKIVGEDVTGTITLGSNIKYLSAIDYPFAVFDQKGKFYGAYDYLLGKQNGAVDRAIYGVLRDKNDFNTATGKYNDDANTAYVLMRADYTMRTYMDGATAKQEYHNNISHAQGNLVIDMCGYTITADKTRTNYIFDATIKQWTGSDDGVYCFPSYYTVKNGAFEVYNVSVLRLYANNKNSTTGEHIDISNKLMSWTFDNVRFGLCEGATENYFFHISNSAGGTSVAPVELVLNDCVFDFETNVPTKDFMIFCSNFIKTTNLKCDLKINGGKILAKDLGKLTFTNFSDANGSTMTFGKGSDGKYLTVVLPRTASFSKFASVKVKTESGTELVLSRATEGAKSTYTLCIDTLYGKVSAEYEDAEKYPFFVFKSDGTFVGAYADWAIDAKASALNNSKTAGSVILLRRDYTYSSGQYNNLSQTNSVTIDLNGFELKTTNSTLFMAQKKNEWETAIKIINGDIVIAGQRPLVRIDTSASFSGKYGFVFECENVTFKLPESDPKTDTLICYSSFVDGDPSEYCNFTFTNCIFDLSNATKAFNIFDVSDNRANVKATINGGEIITSVNVVTVWKNFTADPATVTANVNSSLTFGKANGKDYTKITLPTGTALPIESVNNGALVFVKTAVNAETTTYQLASATFKDYTPKMSITLDNELVMNVYVPVSYTEKMMFNGELYDNLAAIADSVVTLDDGNSYYRLTVALGSSESAKDIILASEVSIGGVSAVVNFTFSIPKYAEKVLADNDATNLEKTLVKDVLAYVKSAYEYFTEHNDEAEIARVTTLIESIIGNYNAIPTSSGITADDVNGVVTAVTLNLDARPTIRFYVTDTSVSFYADGKKLATVSGSDEKGAYVELDVYAYVLAGTITYGEGGSYHISDFLAKSEGEAQESLVECFIKYVESSAEYRNSVISN